MKKQQIVVSREVTIPDTAEDWQLYDKPEAPHVAAKLTAALLESLAFPITELPAAWKNFQQTADQYGDYGACDTEPRDAALAAFDQVFGRTLVRRTIG
jgi:hypothetical protein